MSQKILFTASSSARLDRSIATHFGVSLSAARRLIDEGKALVNGKSEPKGYCVQIGQTIELADKPEQKEDLAPIPEPEALLSVLYQDESLLVIEKPSGIPTHPLRSGEIGTLANALVAKFPECIACSDDIREAGIAHRLDIETSGLLLVARQREAFLLLREAFSAHLVQKTYLAIVEGELPAPRQITGAIAHDPKNVRKVIVGSTQEKNYQEASTDVSPLMYQNGFTLVQAKTRYGRMHQVRAHLSSIGFSLAGDILYKAKVSCPVERSFFLHAQELQLQHPIKRNELKVSAKIPLEVTRFFQ